MGYDGISNLSGRLLEPLVIRSMAGRFYELGPNLVSVNGAYPKIDGFC